MGLMIVALLMTLIYYPHPIFKKKSALVTKFNQTLLQHIDIMQKTMQTHSAIGLGANMCGILQRIIIAPLSDQENPIVMINPEIISQSDETHDYLEASISLPGIEAIITRPKIISIKYQDINQEYHEATVSDFSATVVQHEIDYLDGIIYLDYLPKTKAKMLKDKMKKYIQKMHRTGKNPPTTKHTHHHVHSGDCCG